MITFLEIAGVFIFVCMIFSVAMMALVTAMEMWREFKQTWKKGKNPQERK